MTPGIHDITQAHEELKSTSSLGDILDNLLDKRLGFVSQPGRSGSFFASSVGNPCDRLLWLQFNGKTAPGQVSSILKRIFDHGNITQNRYLEYFKKVDVYVNSEVQCKMTDPVKISGRADFILSINGHPYIVELKTIKASDFNALDGPKKEHLIQLQVYLNLLNIENGAVLYECKDNQQIKLFDTTKNSGLFQQFVSRCERISKLPMMPKLIEVASIHSGYCDCTKVKDSNEEFSNSEIQDDLDS